MKKLLTTFCVLVLALVCIFALPATAQAATEGDYEYSVSGGEATITGYNGAGDITIPATLGGYPVTTIGDYSFEGCDSLTSVVISNNVTTIAEGAFGWCNSLTSVTIGDSVSTIGSGAFSECCSLTGIWVSSGNANFSSDESGVLFNKDKTTLIQTPKGITGSYTIPDNVTTIGVGAFYYCDGLTAVTIGGGVTTIGEWAFYNCDSLTSVTIPDSVTTIDEYAFSFCGNLTSVTIGNSVEIISFSSFSSCGNLTSVTIGDGVTTIGENAFSWCNNLTSVTIPDSVESIDDSAFKDCDSLTIVYYNGTEAQWGDITIGGGNEPLLNATIHFATQEAPADADYTYTVENGEATITGYTGTGGDITIPSTLGGYPVTCITGDWEYGDWEDDYYSAFGEDITSVTIPDGVTTIGVATFYECTNLKTVVLPNSIICIESHAFSDCNSLTNINLPEDLTSIGVCAFSSCTSLTDIVIPEKVTTIGGSAFYGCASLTTVMIPDSVTTIDYSAFYCCTSLTSVSIPDSVTTIGEWAFRECTSLTGIWVDVNNPVYCSDSRGVLFNKNKTTLLQAPGAISGDYTILDSVTAIGDCAFDGCDSLSSMTIGNGVTAIGDATFADCDGLTSVTIGNRVNTIGAQAFIHCNNLTSVTIPNSVTSIGKDAFYNCSNLVGTVYEDAMYLGNSGNPYHAVIKAISEDVEEIKNNERTKVIAGGAFSDCTDLTSAVIPNSVATIGDSAFRYCDNLTVLTIGNGVSTIGEYAFEYCGRLTSVVLPNSLKTIGDVAFSDCDSLTAISIPDSVTAIGIAVFYGCNDLASVTIGDGITTISEKAFYNCDSLVSLNIPDGVTAIGNYAFHRCSSLTSVTIGDGVETIGTWAFSGCTGLTDVYYNGTEAQWGDITVGDYNEELLNATFHFTEEHTHSYTKKVTAPTCTAKGYTTYTCACKDTYIADYVAATGHSYDSGKVTKAATCKAAGVKTYTCSTCKGTKTEAIAKQTKHTYDNNCDTACNVCGAKRTTKHAYKTTTTKATLSKNGSIVKKCTICGNAASTTTISYPKTVKLYATSYTYNGKAKTPTVIVKDAAGKVLKKGTDYTVTYASGRKNVGTYKVTVKMKGNYTGTKTLTFKITPVKVSKCTVKLSDTSFVYNGKAKTPSVTVKDSAGKTLKKGTDYTVSYASGRKNVGTYKVTVKMKGNYTGTKTLTFKIVPKAASINKLTAKSKAIAVKLNRSLQQSTGYQIQYSTSSKFTSAKTVNVTSYKTSTKTISKLKKGKKYYVRVRTYKTVGKTKFYSAWSSYKSVKTK